MFDVSLHRPVLGSSGATRNLGGGVQTFQDPAKGFASSCLNWVPSEVYMLSPHLMLFTSKPRMALGLMMGLGERFISFLLSIGAVKGEQTSTAAQGYSLEETR